MAISPCASVPNSHSAFWSSVGSDIAASALDLAERRSHHAGVVIRVDLHPALVSGEMMLLDRMAGNLLDNAIRYNHPGGRLDLTTGTTASGETILRITNTGQHIDPDTVDRLVEPFVRGTGQRTRTDGGTGRDLSVVHAIVTAHRGELSTVAGETGGLEVTVRLPGEPQSSTVVADLRRCHEAGSDPG